MAEQGREFDLSPPLMQLIDARNVKKKIHDGPHWAFCYSNLQKDSPMIDFALHQCLGPELHNSFCISHLVLRELDTIEDDMNIPNDIKVPILKDFHRHIYDSDLQLPCGTKKHHKDLMDQYHHVSTTLSELQKGPQEVIVETSKRMGAGMAEFLHKEVETVDDYTEYCHIVNGIVWVEMSKYFHASNLKEVAPPDCLADSLGLMAQKQHIIRDFMEDLNKIPKGLEGKRYQVQPGENFLVKGQEDPFYLVFDELCIICNRLRDMVVMGIEGKRFRPTILLLMASALNVSPPGSHFFSGLRTRQQCVAEITEMIHVASLLHDDVLDDANTRRGVPSLNYCMGNKLFVLTLISRVLEHLVTGEIMQMSSTSEQLAVTDYNYGRNVGLAFQLIGDILDFTGSSDSLGKGSLSDIHHGIITAPILFALEEFPKLQEVINCGFDNPANVDLALEYLRKSRGIQRDTEIAIEHANLAASAIDSLPHSEDDNIIISRQALAELTHIVITRTK
ncbi:hypothetical protein MKX03_017451 [Papaver bracteatum]|nr:hypothetical protein MKX03_017451 [Papaver bracteatum]